MQIKEEDEEDEEGEEEEVEEADEYDFKAYKNDLEEAMRENIKQERIYEGIVTEEKLAQAKNERDSSYMEREEGQIYTN